MASPGPTAAAATLNRNDFDAGLTGTHDLEWVVFSRQWVQKIAKYQNVPLDTVRRLPITGSDILVRIGKIAQKAEEELWASVPNSTTADIVPESVKFFIYLKAKKITVHTRSEYISADTNIEPFPQTILANKAQNLIPGRLNALAVMIAVAAYPNVYVRQPVRKFLYVQFILGAMADTLKKFLSSEAPSLSKCLNRSCNDQEQSRCSLHAEQTTRHL